MMPEARELLARSADNLRACEHLIQQRFYDIAASRVYYAIFYAAQALLINEGYQFSSHGAVHAAFGKYFVKSGRIDAKFHRYLLDTFRARQAADYGAIPEVSEQSARTMLGEAQEFLGMAQRLLPVDASGGSD
jgi:uncharacterized protein (UPF0332 family)